MWTRILCGAGALALALALAWAHGNARYRAGELAERVSWHAAAARANARLTEQRIAAERRVAVASQRFADRVAALDPIIIRSTDTVTKYAATPAGAAPCLAADRVRGIDADAAALGLRPADAAGPGDPGLPAIPDRNEP